MPQKRLLAFTIVLLCLIITASGTNAQNGNLLTDPGFDNLNVWNTVVYDINSDTRFSVAPGWQGWYTESPRTQPWMNQIPNGYPHTENGAGFTRSGNRSQEVGRGSATFTAAVYQTVAVPVGSNVIGSAWVRMNLNLNQNPSSQVRVGIDPNGGTTPFDSDIIWSNWAVNVLAWTQLTVSATATGPSVTLFLYATQSVPSDPNAVYWDDASLTVGGTGGTAPPAAGTPAAPVATLPPPVAAFVAPQGAQSDGSIVHTVQSGDTLDAIAVAYGVPRSEIIELNNITNIRLLSIGQQLIISPAGSTSSGSGQTTQPTAETVPETPVVAAGEETQPEDTEPEDSQPAEPTATPTPRPTPTPAPTAPVAVADSSGALDPTSLLSSVCVTLFNDANMNRIQDQDEDLLADGSIELKSGANTVDAIVTDGTPDPFCFSDLEAGEYLAVASAPTGYGLTTADQLRLRVQPGSRLNVAFGAAEGVEPAAPPPADAGSIISETVPEPEEDDSTDQLLQISGLIVFGLAALTLVGGLGAMFIMRQR